MLLSIADQKKGKDYTRTTFFLPWTRAVSFLTEVSATGCHRQSFARNAASTPTRARRRCPPTPTKYIRTYEDTTAMHVLRTPYQ